MTFSRRLRFALSVPVALCGLSHAAPAHAQRTAQDIASARQLYNDGIELRDKGDLKNALEKFRAAHALGNTPLTGIELCRLHSAMKQPVEAREACLSVGRIAALPEESQRSKDARSDAARLAEAEKPKIGSLRLKITGVPPGFQPTVVVDGRAVPPAALNEPRAVNAGVHAITAKVGSGPETRATLETREGESRDLELAVQPPPEGEKPATVGPVQGPAPPPEKKNTLATASFVVAGIAGAVGTIAGLAAISAEGDLSDACADKICGRSDWDKLDSAKTWGNVSSVFFVLAGVALGTGLVATIAAPSRRGSLPSRTALTTAPKRSGVKVTPVFGLGGAGFHGSF